MSHTYWLDHCPVCGGEVVAACKCFRNERVCAKSHVWEWVGDKVVVLNYAHGVPLDPQPDMPYKVTGGL